MTTSGHRSGVTAARSGEAGESPACWHIGLALPSDRHLRQFEDALAGDFDAVASREIESGGSWRLDAYAAAEPDRAGLEARIAAVAAEAGIAAPELEIGPVADIDWVLRFQRNSPPVEAGGFSIHGSHVTAPPRDGLIGILIDAGAAFGAGGHESTRGCLIAFGRLAESRHVSNALDLGSGSGILAIAIARLWDAAVLAADSDPVAVSVTAENAGLNGAGAAVRAIRSAGFRNPAIRARAPYDLIAANILARPLMRLAPGIARHLAPGGVAILSGVLEDQTADLIAACRDAGIELAERVVLGEWHTLVFGARRL